MNEKKICVVTYTKKDGKLVYKYKHDEKLFLKHVAELKEGQDVIVPWDFNGADGKLGQLARVHQNIRKIANESGSTFTEVKGEVKRETGLCVKGECKSFGDCSSDELMAALETTIRMGDFLNLQLR